MNLQQFILQVAGETPQPADADVEDAVIATCNMCGELEIGEVFVDGLCSNCYATKARGYKISQMAGSCRNGAERDHGRLFHARLYTEDEGVSYKALCGAKPGKHSVGWSDWHPEGQQVTCPRCLKRLEKRGLK